MKEKPVALPSREELIKASEVTRAWQLHYYQLLYFHEPQLTHANYPNPFKVQLEVLYGMALNIHFFVPKHPEYSFRVFRGIYITDERILEKCNLIVKAIAEGKTKPHSLACCGLAEKVFCVCNYSCTCPIHGSKCVGSHD